MTRDEQIEVVVAEALAGVVDPCSIATGVPISLDEMGLLKKIQVTDGRVLVELRTTSPFCLQVGNIIERVELVLGDLPGVRTVQIEIDRNDDWMPEMMSASARARLRRLRPLTTSQEPSAPR